MSVLNHVKLSAMTLTILTHTTCCRTLSCSCMTHPLPNPHTSLSPLQFTPVRDIRDLTLPLFPTLLSTGLWFYCPSLLDRSRLLLWVEKFPPSRTYLYTFDKCSSGISISFSTSSIHQFHYPLLPLHHYPLVGSACWPPFSNYQFLRRVRSKTLPWESWSIQSSFTGIPHQSLPTHLPI